MWSIVLFHYSREWILHTAAQQLRYLPKLHVRLSFQTVDDEFVDKSKAKVVQATTDVSSKS